MRIAIDARAYSWAGVGRYIRNLLKELTNINDGNEYVVLISEKDKKALNKDRALHGAEELEAKLVAGSYYSWQEQTVFWRQIEKVEADLFHFPHFNVPIFFDKPYVITIHDVTRFYFPGQSQKNLVRQATYEFVFKRAVERAVRVVCVSETTRSDLESLPIRLSGSPIVIKAGVDSLFFRAVSSREREKIRNLVKEGPYLLYVGVWMNHKNLPSLLAAFKMVLRNYPDLKLVLTGSLKSGYIDVKKISHQLGLGSKNVITLGFVSSQTMNALYKEAHCLMLPSLYEGFGLTGLEAVACGTPVIASNCSSLPEIMGEAAEYVNPEYVPGIAEAITRLLSDEAGKKDLIRKGREVAGNYSWSKCARQTLEVYRDL